MLDQVLTELQTLKEQLKIVQIPSATGFRDVSLPNGKESEKEQHLENQA